MVEDVLPVRTGPDGVRPGSAEDMLYDAFPDFPVHRGSECCEYIRLDLICQGSCLQACLAEALSPCDSRVGLVDDHHQCLCTEHRKSVPLSYGKEHLRIRYDGYASIFPYHADGISQFALLHASSEDYMAYSGFPEAFRLIVHERKERVDEDASSHSESCRIHEAERFPASDA